MAFTKQQLEALKNSLLASGQPILASQHRAQVQGIIDELFDAQSRGNILVAVQSDSVSNVGDTALVFRSGQAYKIPISAIGGANDLSDLGDVIIADVASGDVLRYNAVNDKWENVALNLDQFVTIGTDQTITGTKKFASPILIEGTTDKFSFLGFKQASGGFTGLNGFTSIHPLSSTQLSFAFSQPGGGSKNFIFSSLNVTLNTTPVLQIPNASGTLALTSDLTGFVTLDTAQTITGEKTFNSHVNLGPSSSLRYAKTNVFITPSPDQNVIGVLQDKFTFAVGRPNLNGASQHKIFSLVPDLLTNNIQRNYQLPNASGTLALTSDLTNFVTIDTAQTITGEKTFTNTSLILQSQGTSQPTYLRNSSVDQTNTVGRNSFGFNSSNNIYFNKGSLANAGVFAFNNTGARSYTLQDASGTLALTSDLNDYLPLTGGTLTGALNGTSAVFSGGVNLATVSGNVGIGTTNPVEKLDVVGCVKFSGQTANANLQGGLLDYSVTDARTRLFSYHPTIGSQLVLYTNPEGGNVTERLRITSAGNVGIGTTTPSAKLEVNGTVKFNTTHIPTIDPQVSGQLYRNSLGQLFISL